MATELTAEELRSYDAAGEIVKKLKKDAAARIKSGVRFVDLASYVEDSIKVAGARAAFPCNISVNEVASHFTPDIGDESSFRKGDVVKVDLGVIIEGFIADSAFTVEVETDRHRRLIEATEASLQAAIEAVRPGVYACEIGRVIEASASSRGFQVLKDLFGHNLLKNCLHGGLTIPNYDDGSRTRVREGDVLAIEPFLTAGSGKIDRRPGGNIMQILRTSPVYAADERKRLLLAKLSDDYGEFPFARRWVEDAESLSGLVKSAAVKEYPMLVESDKKPVAQAEHTIIVKRDGCVTTT